MLSDDLVRLGHTSDMRKHGSTTATAAAAAATHPPMHAHTRARTHTRTVEHEFRL